MDQRTEIIQNENIWNLIDENDEKLVKKLYVEQNKEGLNAIRKLLTYIGLIVVLIMFQIGIREGSGVGKGIIAIIVLVIVNIALRIYTKVNAVNFTKSKLLVTRGTCFKKEVEIEKETYYEDGTRHTREYTHYNAFFRMEDSSEYWLDLSEPYYKALSINDTFVFTKHNSSRFGFNYYSQNEMDQLQENQNQDIKEIKKDWLFTEGWKELKGSERKRILNPYKQVKKGKIKPNLIIISAIACLIVFIFSAYVAYPWNDIDSIISMLITMLTFGLVGISFIWGEIRSALNNFIINRKKIYYCEGKCLKISDSESSRKIAFIELDNGLKFAIPQSANSSLRVGNIECINTWLAYEYKNKYIKNIYGFNQDEYEEKLLFMNK